MIRGDGCRLKSGVRSDPPSPPPPNRTPANSISGKGCPPIDSPSNTSLCMSLRLQRPPPISNPATAAAKYLTTKTRTTSYSKIGPPEYQTGFSDGPGLPIGCRKRASPPAPFPISTLLQSRPQARGSHLSSTPPASLYAVRDDSLVWVAYLPRPLGEPVSCCQCGVPPDAYSRHTTSIRCAEWCGLAGQSVSQSEAEHQMRIIPFETNLQAPCVNPQLLFIKIAGPETALCWIMSALDVVKSLDPDSTDVSS